MSDEYRGYDQNGAFLWEIRKYLDSNEISESYVYDVVYVSSGTNYGLITHTSLREALAFWLNCFQSTDHVRSERDTVYVGRTQAEHLAKLMLRDFNIL